MPPGSPPIADRLRTILTASRARRIADADVWLLDDGPWWKLFTGHHDHERTKLALLEALWSSDLPLFVAPAVERRGELPPELLTFLRSHADGVWQLDKTQPAAAFYALDPVSGTGNWTLYAARRPVAARLPDLFRTRPDVIVAFMAAHEVTVMVDVFHDDVEWCVALARPDG